MMVRLENSGWPGDVSRDVNAPEITPKSDKGLGVVGRRKEMVGRAWQVPLPKARLKSITGQLWGVALGTEGPDPIGLSETQGTLPQTFINLILLLSVDRGGKGIPVIMNGIFVSSQNSC